MMVIANNLLSILILMMINIIITSGGNSQVNSTNSTKLKTHPAINIRESAPSEANAYENRKFVPFSPDGIIGKSRVLMDRQKRRAYDGAPPKIPHATTETYAKPLGSECTTCHTNGGYVKDYQAFAPVTPHPNWSNCRQCHVPMQTSDLFHFNKFEGISQNELKPKGLTAFLPGGPPPIPHAVGFRGSCLSCHAGAAAIARIRTTHPDRINCRQCHVPSNANANVWQRGSK